MPLSNNLKFSCSALNNNYGQTIRALKPDDQGAYEVVVGAVGCPTRNDVIYETDSLVSAMSDPNSRFNICLKDGNLAGEYGHPVINTKEDMPRLMRIDEHYISHYFTKIWIDDTTPLNIGGCEGFPIRAKVVPTGPYGEILRKQLEDPCHNTSFSIRSLCLPSSGPNPKFEYRKVQIIVTFDTVAAPGYQVASKRYVSGSESFNEIDVDRNCLENTIASCAGMEARTMISNRDIHKLYNDQNYSLNGNPFIRNISGNRSLVMPDGLTRDASALLYRR